MIVYFDLEGGDANKLFRWDPADGAYVRLCGVAVDDGPTVGVTPDPAKLLHILERADHIVGHNILRFDLMALAVHCGADYDALAAKAIDTYPWAKLQDPPGSRHTKPWGQKGYYGLDALAQRLGASGKVTGDDGLASLKDEFGGYHLIPVTDPRYIAYLRADVEATRAVFHGLGGLEGLDAYAAREMRVVAAQCRMTLNGWRADVPLLRERVQAEADRKDAALQWLADECGVPLAKEVSRGRGSAKVTVLEKIKAPLATKEGRQALEDAFRARGARFVPRTESGLLALSSDAMGDGTWTLGKGAGSKTLPGMKRAYAGNQAVADMCDRIALVASTVAKYQEIHDHLVGDRVHGGIGEDQASGRWAMVKPSLTNLGKRGGKVIQRAVFLPEPGHVLISADLDQVDMRGIAAHCQDPAYMAMFAPGMDAHSEVAKAVFGRADGEWRDHSKKIGHGWNYGMSVNGIVAGGVERTLAEQFDQMMNTRFPQLCEWRMEVRAQGEAGQLLDNGFGRLMRCDPGRAWTQAPALIGQGAARDIMCTSILRFLDALPEGTAWLRGVVHDEVVLSVPQERVEEVSKVLVDSMTWEWKGVPITAGVSKPGENWASCYSK